jgi:hypothetical protein
MDALPVRGTARRRGPFALLVLNERLDGHDSFLRAELDLDPDGVRLRVRVHTFDHVTVLHPAAGSPITGGSWTGQLRLAPARRTQPVPDDLADALAAAGLPADLVGLDARERRHLLGYLSDAPTPPVRRGRISTIVAGLRGMTA